MKRDAEAIARVARAICQSKTCTGFKCCRWPGNGGRQHLLGYRGAPRCLVEDGRFDDAAIAAIAAMEIVTVTPK